MFLANNNAAMYHAYNELQSLTQQFTYPISTAAIVVVGQQTDGKSALVEALMGFQFNHVGGGTKTRRPIALQMQYRADCEQPRCYLVEDGHQRPVKLHELKEHIERENCRLEALGAFEASELIVRIDYKYCPNLSIIDTPGLLAMDTASPSAVGAVAPPLTEAVRDLILAQISPAERIILCVEETRCWQMSPVRSVVASVDPAFTRTLVVSTKLDTKFAQLSSAAELRSFLAASDLHESHPDMLGGPFFTAVPVGRVGGAVAHGFASDDEYQLAISQLEQANQGYLWEVLSDDDAAARDQTPVADVCSAVGVSRLRLFLEELLRDRYSTGLASIILQLQKAADHISTDVSHADSLLDDLSPDRLRGLYSTYVDHFMERFSQTLSGSTTPEALDCAQTSGQEHADAGQFCEHSAHGVEGADLALFGGAQYYRLLREFETCLSTLPAVSISEEELCNTLGMDAQHDALYIGRTVCCLAISHSFVQLDSLLKRLQARLFHILGRMLKHAASHADTTISLRVGRSRSALPGNSPRQLHNMDMVAFLRKPLEESCCTLLQSSLEQCMQVLTPSSVAPRVKG